VSKINSFRIEVSWVVTPCGVAVGFQRFGEPSRLHLQSEVKSRYFGLSHRAAFR